MCVKVKALKHSGPVWKFWNQSGDSPNLIADEVRTMSSPLTPLYQRGWQSVRVSFPRPRKRGNAEYRRGKNTPRLFVSSTWSRFHKWGCRTGDT